jgi:hypothetical protein
MDTIDTVLQNACPTYAQLAELISKMTNEQKQMNVTVYLQGPDEFVPVQMVNVTTDTDVLDENHPYLVIFW